MISLKNRNELNLDSMIATPTLEHQIDSRDFISMSLPYPFDEEIYDKKLKALKELIDSGRIKKNVEHVNLVFDLLKSRPGDYSGWKFVIDYAKKHNIKFKLNEMYAISPLELEKYIENFSKINATGQKSLLFSRQSFLSSGNIFTASNNTHFINEPTVLPLFAIDSNLQKNVQASLQSQTQSTISLHLKNEDQFGHGQLKTIKSFVKFLKNHLPNKKIDLCIFSKHYYFSSKEFKKLLKLEKYIRTTYNKDYELKFYSGNSIVNKTQILKANSMIDSTVKYLKSSNLSPYEKLIYVRKLLTEKAYFYGNESSQDLYSALNSRQMVCVSYSLIFKAIFDELNDPNIKVNVQLYKNESLSNSIYHALNNVYVNDSKYEIEGYYDTDLTYSPSNLLTDFMIPPNDTFNSCKNKNVEKVDFFSLGNLLDNKRVCYFSKELNEHDYTINKTIEKNTLKYLNTPLGKRALVKAKKQKHKNSIDYLYSAIHHCLNSSKPIPIEKTKKALEYVAQNQFNMSETNAKNYSANVVIETIFNSIFDYNRDACTNAFSFASKEAEKFDNSFKNSEASNSLDKNTRIDPQDTVKKGSLSSR